MTQDALPLRDFLTIALIAFAATLRIGLVLTGWHWTRTGRRVYR